MAHQDAGSNESGAARDRVADARQLVTRMRRLYDGDSASDWETPHAIRSASCCSSVRQAAFISPDAGQRVLSA